MLLVKQAPRSPWDAVLTQLVLWSFRRFCANRIITGGDSLWDDHISLLTEFAPPQFKPHLDEWIEHLQSIPNLSELDGKLRTIVADLEDEEKEDDLSLLLDVDLSKQIQAWLGKTFAPFSLFPGEDESDDSIDQTKLNSIVFQYGERHIGSIGSLRRKRKLGETKRHGKEIILWNRQL
jgi:hypothetical protein